jgi:hypothetical protein
MCSCDVTRPDAGGEVECGVVGDLRSIVFVGEPDEHGDVPEDFRARNTHVVGHIGEN